MQAAQTKLNDTLDLSQKRVFDEVHLHQRFALTWRGRLACMLVERWGLVAGQPADEEDSAGRAKLDLMPPERIVSRACETAALLAEEIERRGWFVDVPSLDEIKRQHNQ